MDFADWDWTSHALDADDQPEDTTKGFAYTQQTGVIFLVDSSPQMFVKQEEDESNFDKCLKCIRSVFQKKVIGNEKDLLGVVFYGLKKSSTADGRAVDVYQELNQLNIRRITDLEAILEDSESFASEFGHSDNYDMSDVLWACSNVFAKCNKTLGEKKILLFTCNDNPHKNDASLKRKAVAKATDLKAMGIDLELLPMSADTDGTFNVELFYKELLGLDENSNSDSFPEPSSKFEDLLSRVYRKEHKRRALGRIPFKIGNSTELSVGIYCLCRRNTLPTSVKIHSATNSEVRTQTKVFNAATGDDVMPQEIQLYQEYAGKKICLETEDVSEIKRFGISGLKLQGFKKKSEVTLHLHVKPSHFIYPDETSIKGSSTLFSALLSRCAARDMVVVCWYVPRTNSAIELVYLLPQLEERDDQQNQTTPPGFHVIFSPFKEDIREISASEEPTTANDVQVEKCKAMVQKLSFPYEPSLFENPSLQKFYSNLEAMALNRDEPDEITDYTIPNLKKMDRKAGKEIEEFKDSVFPEDYTGPATAKRPAASSGTAAKKAKVDLTDAKQLALSDGLSKLTVADLKTVVRNERIHTSVTKKADLISAIKHHFGA